MKLSMDESIDPLFGFGSTKNGSKIPINRSLKKIFRNIMQETARKESSFLSVEPIFQQKVCAILYLLIYVNIDIKT